MRALTKNYISFLSALTKKRHKFIMALIENSSSDKTALAYDDLREKKVKKRTPC